MATTKPRITITLSDRQHQLLRSISESSGQSMSAFVGDLLETSEPVLERLASTFQALKARTNIERAKIIQTLDDAQTAFEPLAMAAVDQLDMFLGNIEKASAVSGAPARSEASTAAPLTADASGSPSTNRGVTPTDTEQCKPAPLKAVRPVSKKNVFQKNSKNDGMQPS